MSVKRVLALLSDVLSQLLVRILARTPTKLTDLYAVFLGIEI